MKSISFDDLQKKITSPFTHKRQNIPRFTGLHNVTPRMLNNIPIQLNIPTTSMYQNKMPDIKQFS